MTSIEGIVRSELALYLLECGRISGVVMVAPLAWLHAPLRIRVALVLLLGWIAHGLSLQARVPEHVIDVGLAMTTEVAVGIAVGFIVRLIVAIAEICGEAMTPAIGLGMASAFDPSTHTQQSHLTSILRYLAIWIALIMGVHRVLLGGLLAGFRLLPVGTAADVALVVPDLVSLSSSILAAGVRIALPLIAILYMTQIALAFIARAAPQMQVFNVGFAVMLGVGLTVFALLLPDVSRAFVIELSQLPGRLEDLLISLGAVP